MQTANASSIHAGPIAVPETIAGIDADWLTLALGSVDPGIEVRSSEVVQSLGGACTKLRIALRTNREDFPPSIIVKGCLEPHSKGMLGRQIAEARYYEELVPLLGVPTIDCFFAQGDPDAGAVLIMEDLDLRGARCLRAAEPMSRDLAEAFLDVLARVHARWWNDPALEEGGPLSWVPGFGDRGLANHLALLSDPERTAEKLSLPRAAAVSRLFHDSERLVRAYDVMWSNHLGLPLALLHGDPHLANLYVDRDGGPGLLDWTCRRAPWALDISYFIVGSLDLADRRSWEKSLLRHYLSCLRDHGVDAPDFDEAWRAYCCWITWGLVVWLVNRTDYHSEAAITAAAARFGAAMVDNDSFGALGV